MTKLQECVCCGFLGAVEEQRVISLDASRTRQDKSNLKIIWICDVCYIDMIV
jgi:hypothetical protein